MTYISPPLFTIQTALSATFIGLLNKGPFLTKVTAGIIPQVINSSGFLGATEEFLKKTIEKLPYKKYNYLLLSSSLLPVAAAIYTFAIYGCVFFFNIGPLSLLEATFSGILSLCIALDSYHGSETVPKIGNFIRLILNRSKNHDTH